jgi:hypothetical protein
MVLGEGAVGCVVEERVVERAGSRRIELVDPGDEPDAVFAGDLAESVAVGARYRYGLACE